MRSRLAIGPRAALVLALSGLAWGLAPRLFAQTAAAPTASPTSEDVVTFKDGTTVTGKVLSQDETAVVIKTTAGTTETIPWSEVKKVTLGKVGAAEPSGSLPPLPPAEPPPAPATTAQPGAGATTHPAPTATAPTPSPSSWVPATPPPNQPAPSKRRGDFEIGARFGYGIPMGNVAKGEAMSDELALQVPVWFDVGYRFVSGIHVGMYLSYGFLKTKSNTPVCPPDYTDCTGTDVRAGLQLVYHAASDADVDPWFGFGFGREWLSYQATLSSTSRFAPNVTGHVTVEGWNYLELHFGVDFALARKLGVGPFATFSMGKFTDRTVTVSGSINQSESQSIPSTSEHQWVILGVRGAFRGF